MNETVKFFSKIAVLDTCNLLYTHVIINSSSVFFNILSNGDRHMVARIRYPKGDITMQDVVNYFINKGHSDTIVTSSIYEKFAMSPEQCTILFNTRDSYSL